jgi:hypothetical protein
VSAMDQIVRPYVSGVDTPGNPTTIEPFTRTTIAPPTPVGFAVLQVGRIGSTKTFSGSLNYSITYYTKKYPKEIIDTPGATIRPSLNIPSILPQGL